MMNLTAHPEQNTRNENEYAVTFKAGDKEQTFYMFGTHRGAQSWAGREKQYFAPGTKVTVKIQRVYEGGQA